MKKFILFSFLVFCSSLLAQKNIIDVLIIKQNNDSLKVKMEIDMIKHHGKILVSENDFFKKLNIVDSNGAKLYKIKPNEIKEFSFDDFENNKRIYFKDPSRNQLMELYYNGKIKVYTQFVTMDHYVGVYFLFMQPDGSPYKVGLFENNTKILLRITDSKPELKKMIEGLQKDEDMIIKVLTEYEKDTM